MGSSDASLDLAQARSVVVLVRCLPQLPPTAGRYPGTDPGAAHAAMAFSRDPGGCGLWRAHRGRTVPRYENGVIGTLQPTPALLPPRLGGDRAARCDRPDHRSRLSDDPEYRRGGWLLRGRRGGAVAGNARRSL